MSPRRNRPRGGGSKFSASPGGRRDDASGPRFGLERSEEWRGEDWAVRHVAGAAGRTYRCPGCDQEIHAVPHVVAWPLMGDVDDRRHWHKACWNARDRRSARVQRSRNAPRY